MNPKCVGVEYSGGRCEIWTRLGGIESAVALNGFTCLHFLRLGFECRLLVELTERLGLFSQATPLGAHAPQTT